MTGHSYKLKYFPVRGRGEPIRYLLSYLGVPFEDIRIPYDDWTSVKPTTPFGKVPVLEIDGKGTHQSRAICRYLGKQASIGGADDWEDMLIDITADTIEDLRNPMREYYWEEDPVRKAAQKAPLMETTLPFYLSRLDEQVKSNGGYFVNGKLTWADIFFAGHMDTMSVMVDKESIIKDYPNLKALYDKVHAIPKIAAWVAKRPKTSF